MKKKLTTDILKKEAKLFCETTSKENHISLLGITDGKAVGTYVEHKFKAFLEKKYILEIGSSARGIDLPGEDINTDIKVTSITQPQSSCPFEDASQKIYGLGYNVLIFVYEKIDGRRSCKLKFTHCTFIEKSRTADFTLTKRLREMLADGANQEDITSFLVDRNIPGDDITIKRLAETILQNKPEQGYLTISNALQWRLQYSRVISLNNQVQGVTNYEW